MPLRQPEYLITPARERHLARAAAACHVSQPSLSAGIRTLERDLKVMIVRRGRRLEGGSPREDEGRGVAQPSPRDGPAGDGRAQWTRTDRWGEARGASRRPAFSAAGAAAHPPAVSTHAPRGPSAGRTGRERSVRAVAARGRRPAPAAASGPVRSPARAVSVPEPWGEPRPRRTALAVTARSPGVRCTAPTPSGAPERTSELPRLAYVVTLVLAGRARIRMGTWQALAARPPGARRRRRRTGRRRSATRGVRIMDQPNRRTWRPRMPPAMAATTRPRRHDRGRPPTGPPRDPAGPSASARRRRGARHAHLDPKKSEDSRKGERLALRPVSPLPDL
ncbi:LysR family transcriptional regulator [Streptomyces sp. NPDC019507]|uniref:LysR family transcriptional regulator n=1 Tax=Streptomyces sp. NPDC019507 TaxID=3154689 RepID=UPI00340D5575